MSILKADEITMITSDVILSNLKVFAKDSGYVCRGRPDFSCALSGLNDNIFGKKTIKTFTVTAKPGNMNCGVLYAYSNHNSAQIGKVLDGYKEDVLTNIRVRSFKPKWAVGQQLSFEIKTIPERKSTKNNKKIDAHYFDLMKSKYIKYTDSYTRWLKEKTIDAFDIHDGINIEKDIVNIGLDGSELKKTAVKFKGTLTIRSKELFQTAVASGIGKYKKFGYGMLLLKAI